MAVRFMMHSHETPEDSEELSLDELSGVAGGVMPAGFVSDPLFRDDILRLVKECEDSGGRGGSDS